MNLSALLLARFVNARIVVFDVFGGDLMSRQFEGVGGDEDRAIVEHGMMVRTDNNDVRRCIAAVVWCAEGPDVVPLAITAPIWEIDRETANLASIIVAHLEIRDNFRITNDATDGDASSVGRSRIFYINGN